MKASELQVSDLMVGDWVEFTSKYGYGKGQVAGIEPKEGSVEPSTFSIIKFREDGTTRLFVHLSNRCVRPIPLTPEILEKNGFTTEDEVHYQIKDRTLELLWQEIPFGKYQVDMVKTEHGKNEYGQDYYIDHYIATIDYVHTLQHALRLCGIEKEITL